MSHLFLRFIIILVLISIFRASSAAEEPLPFEKASIAFRIGESISLSDERFEQLLTLFEKHKGATDQITFFVSTTHAPLQLAEHERRCKILKERMRRARELGYETGLNILCTVGHHNEDLPNSVGPELARAANINGDETQGSLCPNQENFREYARELYRMLVEAEPDYIWIDDDVRSGHGPVGETCYCDSCIALFSKETGTEYTRETLKNRIGDYEVRMQWLNHNRDTYARLFELIEKTVHDLKPDMPLGFMTGERYAEGYDFHRWADVLAGPNDVEVLWRPGGGFYRDEPISGMIEKSQHIGRQIALLPKKVRCIQSEIENFPYQRLMKSARITTLEAGSHIAAGCTGAAFNVMTMNEEPLDEYEPLIVEIARKRPFYDLMVKHSGRETIAGVFSFWNIDFWAYAVPSREYHELFAIGVPPAYTPEGSCGVTILFEHQMNRLSQEQLEKILSGGVFMNVGALETLNTLGFGELTGLALEETFWVDSIDRLTEHPLNGNMAGRTRDCRQSFWHAPAHTLKKTDPKAEMLAERIDYTGKSSGYTAAIFENKLGGRIYVGGYHPYDFLHSHAKTVQTRNIMRWLSGDELPAYVESYHKMNLWTRNPKPNGTTSLILLNNSYDAAEETTVMIRTKLDKIEFFDENCVSCTVSASGSDGPYRRFILPNPIDPWSMGLIVVSP